jgi:DNA-binding NarL/FixJ family response regulator
MRVIASGPQASRTAELKVVIGALRTGLPILVTRDQQAGQRVVVLEPDDKRLWVGRGVACDVRVANDQKASRCHAELVRVADGWAIVDDGLSRNGTFVDGKRIAGRRRLHDGEVVRLGASSLAYRVSVVSGAQTRPADDDDPLAVPDLTRKQRHVLVLLCRPLLTASVPAIPATNREIADELVLSVPAVVTHIRTLFEKFAIEPLPQNRKRARLAELAILTGAVSERDL